MAEFLSPKNPPLPPLPPMQALRSLRKETTYLWPKLVRLPIGQTEITCNIRESTFQKISRHLDSLVHAGLMKYYISHHGEDKSVLRLHLMQISRSLPELIKQLAAAEGTG